MIQSQSRIRFHLRRGGYCLAIITGVFCGGPLLAADALRLLPADVAGAVVFRDMKAATQKFNPFLKQLKCEHGGIELDELGEFLGLSSGDWDPSSPVMIVLARPGFERESMIVAFKPAEGSGLLSELREHGRRIWKREGNGGESFLAMREGIAFSAMSAKSLRMIRHRPPEQSLGGALDDQEKRMLAESDAFIRLDLNRWREKLSPFVVIGLGMMKLSVAAQDQKGPETAAFMDWLAGGVRSFIDQMESTSVSLTFDRKTIRLNHHHRFTPGLSVANYLGTFRSENEDVLSLVPNRPFLLFATSNWRGPTGECLTASLMRHVMEMEPVASRIPEETRKRLNTELNACYDQIRGSAFMLSSTTDTALPLQMMGGYFVKDSASALKQLCYIQENANEAMSAVLPSAHCMGKFKARRERDVDLMELQYKSEDLPSEVQSQVQKVYGQKVRYQQAADGPNRVVYTLAEPPASVVDLVKSLPEARVDKSPAVRRILDRLPEHPQLLVVVDLQRLLSAVPHLALSEMGTPEKPKTTQVPRGDSAESRGLIGWAVAFEPTSISGGWAMDSQDALETLKAAREMPEKLSKMTDTPRTKIIVNRP
jgi:hypothetical protein